MRQTLLGVSSLLLGMALLMLGNGSLPTVLALRLAASGESAWLIGLVIAYGIGAIAGPPVAALSIECFGANDLFLFCGIVATGAAGTIFWRMHQFEALSLED